MGHQVIEQAVFTNKEVMSPHQKTTLFAVFTEDGDPAVVPAQAAAQADVAALTSATITGGEPPTEAEYNALRADLVATRTTLNSLLAKLRTAGVIDT
jgi:hypothetical protein